MDAKSTFVKRFGDLVTLFRVDPGNDAAQELALSAAAAAVAHSPLEIAAGLQGTAMPAGLALTERMLARQVDCLRVSAGAPALELESLARALAHDLTPVRSSPSIEVELVRLLAPPPDDRDCGGSPPGGGAPAPSGAGSPPEHRRGVERRTVGERRLFLLENLRTESARLLAALAPLNHGVVSYAAE